MKIVSVKWKPLLVAASMGLLLLLTVLLLTAKNPEQSSDESNDLQLEKKSDAEIEVDSKRSPKTNLVEGESPDQKKTWEHENELLRDVKNVLNKHPAQVKDEIAKEKEQHVEQQKAKESQEKLKVVVEPVNPTGGQGGIPSDPDVKMKQDFIRDMMRHAWGGYKRYAWGANEVRPITKKGHSAGIFGSGNSGATIVDAIDTLHIMGLSEEYLEARNWIALNFKFDPRGDISIFETNIRFIGGFLSIYALTGDKMFRIKAEDVARKLLPAFDTPTGIPKSLINLKTYATKNYPWAAGGSSILSEFGTLQLEMEYLSHVSGDPVFASKIKQINSHIKSIRLDSNLYSNFLNPNTGKWGSAKLVRQKPVPPHYSVGALGDSFYEYLLKGWLFHSQTNSDQREMYDSAATAIKQNLVQIKDGFTYVAEMKGKNLVHKMDHLACFVGGMFALGGFFNVHEASGYISDAKQKNEEFVKLGADVTATCHQSYTQTTTKIGPDVFHFEGKNLATATRANERIYLLRPEVIESYFILWRTTKDPKYREWGWEAAQAIERHCRQEAGYSGIKDVTNAMTAADDVQQSFFLAETLKYLYLLFSEDSLIPLDHWVFNTEAHPLPILPS